MKTVDIRQMTVEELNAKLKELKSELFVEFFSCHVSDICNFHELMPPYFLLLP